MITYIQLYIYVQKPKPLILSLKNHQTLRSPLITKAQHHQSLSLRKALKLFEEMQDMRPRDSLRTLEIFQLHIQGTCRT